MKTKREEKHITDLEKIKSMTIALYDMVKIEDCGLGLGITQHPFVGNMFFYDGKELIQLDNKENLKLCRDKYVEMINNSGLTRIYTMVRSPYKMLWFSLCEEFMSDEDYGNLLQDSWISQDNPNQDVNVSRKECVKLFKKANKRYLMEESDYEYYERLPEVITVYRGVGIGREKFGLSWTDSTVQAEWFKDRFNRNGKEGYLLKAEISKKDVLAYFAHEQELVVDVFKIKKNIEVVK